MQQLNKEKSYLFYSNLGYNVDSVKDILNVAKKVIDTNIKLIINTSWPLTLLCSLEFENTNIIPTGDLDQIKHWDNKIFMNFSYKELKKYLHKIKYIIINYIDIKNIELCAVPNFVHNWKLFTALRFMAESHIEKQEKQKKQPDKGMPRRYKYIFEAFVPLNVCLDNDGILRLRSISNFTQPTETDKIPSICTYPSPAATRDRQDTATFKYPFERIPSLDTIEMKQYLQRLFTKPTCMFIVNLDTTYSIYKCLYNILMEELYVDVYFTNTDKYAISSANVTFITNTPAKKTTESSDNRNFFYFRDCVNDILDKNTVHSIELKYFQYYIALVNLLRDNKKLLFVTAPFEKTLDERMSHGNFIGFNNLDLSFSRLQSNLKIIL